MTRFAEIEEAAARWVMRRDEPDWTDVEADALEVWLEAAPEHRTAFWRQNHIWRKADRLAALRRPPNDVSPRRRIRLLLTGLAIAAGLTLCVSIIVVGGYGRVDRFETPIGGHQSVPLADGSRVEMNTGTRLRTEITGGKRMVWLDQGEAYFEVVHDVERPFTVRAGRRTITVLGTKFSVRRDGDRVEVAVADGRVRIDDDRPAEPARILTRGEIALAQGEATLVAAPSLERVESQLSWRSGILDFEGTTLADAAAEFNRYNRRQLVIADPQVAAMRIDGRFPATEIDAFTRLLQRGFGLKVEAADDRITISG